MIKKENFLDFLAMAVLVILTVLFAPVEFLLKVVKLGIEIAIFLLSSLQTFLLKILLSIIKEEEHEIK